MNCCAYRLGTPPDLPTTARTTGSKMRISDLILKGKSTRLSSAGAGRGFAAAGRDAALGGW
ncbi:hypothetical protein GCM10009550_75140 [Actinocorallia libanotica]|uniref:Uncharacterized protein n=1 Tax=Actinocorallia libanotica TaxID=46162 RepID=A0ABN1S014_9ACTN